MYLRINFWLVWGINSFYGDVYEFNYCYGLTYVKNAEANHLYLAIESELKVISMFVVVPVAWSLMKKGPSIKVS